jgi:hypothetical protein
MLRNENLESGDGGSTGICSPHGGGDGKICCPVAFHGGGDGGISPSRRRVWGSILRRGISPSFPLNPTNVSSDREFLLVFLSILQTECMDSAYSIGIEISFRNPSKRIRPNHLPCLASLARCHFPPANHRTCARAGAGLPPPPLSATYARRVATPCCGLAVATRSSAPITARGRWSPRRIRHANQATRSPNSNK